MSGQHGERVFVWPRLTPDQKQWIRTAAGDAEALHFADERAGNDSLAAFTAATIAFGNLPPEWLGSAPSLRWLQLTSTGFEAYAEPGGGAAAGGFAVTTSHGLFARPVAETAIAGLLSIYRELGTLCDAQRTQTWRSTEVRARSGLLSHRRVLIIGRGSLAVDIAALLRAFGCCVVTLGRDHDNAELDEHLTLADVVVAAVPHTPRTVGLLDRARLSRLRAGAVIVNVGRGSVLDEEALAEALHRGRIAGAVLDTTIEEPLPAGHFLWTCPRVVLTQHTGGGWEGEWESKVELFLDNLARFHAGRALHNLVDLDADRPPATARRGGCDVG